MTSSGAQFGGFIPRDGESGASGYRAEAPTATSIPFQTGSEYQSYAGPLDPDPNASGANQTWQGAVNFRNRTGSPLPLSANTFGSWLFKMDPPKAAADQQQ